MTASLAEALNNLNTALRRYERLASPPQHLQLPLCGDLEALVLAERRARERGDHVYADELSACCDREAARRQNYQLWLCGQRSRSKTAWWAMADRLTLAIDWCQRTGVLEGNRLTFAKDRQADCEARIRSCDVQVIIDTLN